MLFHSGNSFLTVAFLRHVSPNSDSFLDNGDTSPNSDSFLNNGDTSPNSDSSLNSGDTLDEYLNEIIVLDLIRDSLKKKLFTRLPVNISSLPRISLHLAGCRCGKSATCERGEKGQRTGRDTATKPSNHGEASRVHRRNPFRPFRRSQASQRCVKLDSARWRLD